MGYPAGGGGGGGRLNFIACWEGNASSTACSSQQNALPAALGVLSRNSPSMQQRIQGLFCMCVQEWNGFVV